MKRLTRIPQAGRIAGVCAGLAAYFDVDATFVRLAWLILSIVPGCFIGGVIAYAVGWIVMPPSNAAGLLPAPRLHRSASDVRIAGVCAGIAEFLDIDPTIVRLAWAILTIFPGAIVLGVLAYVVAWIVMPRGIAPPLQTVPSTP